jgi:EF-P beta-lysylation protein EpmB
MPGIGARALGEKSFEWGYAPANAGPAPHLVIMITRSVPAWQAELASAVTDPLDLLARLGLSGETALNSGAPPSDFPFRVPLGYVARMRPGDPADPLLRQVLPTADEGRSVPGYGLDPVGDMVALTATGVLQKYAGRALLITTGACPMHCRYCFRRHFPYAEAHAGRNRWREALDHLRAESDVREVILSGGDPLSLADEKLSELVVALADIPHLERLRIHTRAPVVLPSRVDDGLMAWLTGTRLRVLVVLHANHANELDARVEAACARLAAARVTLLNQAVLLKGVNDAVPVLSRLSERLFELSVLPYYLHQMDRVQGAAHFVVEDALAVEILAGLRAKLPGYLVPRLVREHAGMAYKTPVETSVENV